MRVKKCLALGMLMLAGFGCSTGEVNQKLDSKLQTEGVVGANENLQAETQKSIADSPELTAPEKDQLTELRRSSSAQYDLVREQGLKLRAILAHDLLSADYDQAEINAIKKRLRAVEDQKLSIIFDAVDRSNVILGRLPASRAAMARDLLFIDARVGSHR